MTSSSPAREQEAEASTLPPYVTEAERLDPGLIAIGNAWTKRLFDGDFYLSRPPDRARPAISCSYSRRTGTGCERPLDAGRRRHRQASDLRRALARRSRRRPVRSRNHSARGKHLFRRHPDSFACAGRWQATASGQIVATLQGMDLEHGRSQLPHIRVILITVGSCASLMRVESPTSWITPLVMDTRRSSARVRTTAGDGITQVSGSAVGGCGAADRRAAGSDVYLTTSPRAGGEPNTPMYPGPLDGAVVARKRGTDGESGVTFEHIRLSAT